MSGVETNQRASGRHRPGVGSPALSGRLLTAGLVAVAVEMLLFTWARSCGWDLEWAVPGAFVGAAGVAFGLGTTGPGRPAVPVFLATAGLCYFMKVGLLAGLLELTGVDERLASAGTILIGWVLVLASIAWLGRPEPSAIGWRSGISMRLALALGSYALALGLLYVVVPELLHEEAYYWAFARFPDLGYLDHPPLAAWTIWATTGILGHTEPGVRAGAFLAWLVAAGFVHALTRRIFDRRVARGAALLVATLPAFFMFGWVMCPDAPLMACWAAAVYYLHRAIVEGENRAWIGVGTAFGLGLLAKYTIGLLGIAGLTFMLVDRRSRRWLSRPAPYLAGLLAVAIFSPVVVWNARNEWISFWWQTGRRLMARGDFDLPDLLGAVMVLGTPVGVAGLLALVSCPRTEPSRSRRFLLTMTLVPLTLLAFFSLSRSIKFNWAAPTWLAALPLLAEPLIRGVPPDGRALERRIQQGWRPALVVMLLLYGAGLQYLTLGFAGQPYGLNETGVGWRDLGAGVEAIVDEAEAELGERPLVVGMDKDRIPGWLAFYRSRALALRRSELSRGEAAATTAGDHLLAGKGSFYRWHFDPCDYSGRPMLLVGHEAEDLDNEGVRLRATELGPIGTIAATMNGRVAARYHYRMLHGYSPQGAERTLAQADGGDAWATQLGGRWPRLVDCARSSRRESSPSPSRTSAGSMR